jgi:serine/threonine protein kinase
MATKRNSSLEKYQKMALLGEGAFAKVYLVRCQEDKEIYALKAINKKIVV